MCCCWFYGALMVPQCEICVYVTFWRLKITSWSCPDMTPICRLIIRCFSLWLYCLHYANKAGFPWLLHLKSTSKFMPCKRKLLAEQSVCQYAGVRFSAIGIMWQALRIRLVLCRLPVFGGEVTRILDFRCTLNDGECFRIVSNLPSPGSKWTHVHNISYCGFPVPVA